MDNEKYSNYPLSISAILGLIEANDIAIPEIQRPFVWKKTQVRDLIDSLYKGYPTGYLILWKNPNVKLKDGTISSGKKVLIDGQQRITALMTAVAGRTVFNSEYQEERIKIAFDPIAALSGEPDKKEKAYIWQTAIGLQKEMSAYEWAKGHSGVLLSNGVVEKLDKQWEEELRNVLFAYCRHLKLYSTQGVAIL